MLGMWYNREETKSFNTKEKVRAMAKERKKAFVEKKQHTHVWETLQQRREKERWLGGAREIFGRGEKTCTPPGCIATKRKRASTPKCEKESFNAKEKEREPQLQGEKKRTSMHERENVMAREKENVMAKERKRLSTKGREHVHPQDILQQRGEIKRVMAKERIRVPKQH